MNWKQFFARRTLELRDSRELVFSIISKCNHSHEQVKKLISSEYLDHVNLLDGTMEEIKGDIRTQFRSSLDFDFNNYDDHGMDMLAYVTSLGKSAYQNIMSDVCKYYGNVKKTLLPEYESFGYVFHDFMYEDELIQLETQMKGFKVPPNV